MNWQIGGPGQVPGMLCGLTWGCNLIASLMPPGDQ